MSDVTTTARFVFFWGGWPSQWHKCRFRVEGLEYNCCEQFMMAEKARVFADWEAEAAILATPEVSKRFLEQGAEPIGDTPAEMAKFVAEERERWGRVIRSAHVTIE